MNIKRGQIYYADLSPVIGSEQGGKRPVLIVSNDIGNKYSPVVICAPITSKMDKAQMPTHVNISGLMKDSQVMLEQVKTIDKNRLSCFICRVDGHTMAQVDKAIKISLGVGD